MLLRDTHSHWQVKQIRHVTAGFKQSFNLSASTVRNTLAVLCNSKLLPFQAKHFPRREYWHLVTLLKETHPGLTHVYTLQLKMYIGFPREESCILLVLGWSLWLIFSDVVMFFSGTNRNITLATHMVCFYGLLLQVFLYKRPKQTNRHIVELKIAWQKRSQTSQ